MSEQSEVQVEGAVTPGEELTVEPQGTPADATVTDSVEPGDTVKVEGADSAADDAAKAAADAAAADEAAKAADAERAAADADALTGAGAPEGAALPVEGDAPAEHPEPTAIAFVQQDNVTEPGVQTTHTVGPDGHNVSRHGDLTAAEQVDAEHADAIDAETHGP